MPEKHFTHLHLHTDYSLLDGAISINKLIEYGKINNRQALAISDHGNIFGAVKFFEKCKKASIKPILGIEAYLTEDIQVKDIHNRYYHLLILVQNKAGYKNICKLISESYINGFYFKPRIDYALLKKYNEGLIVTSTCLGGHIPQLLLQERDKEVSEKLDFFSEVFGDRYYLEVQPPYLDEQKIVNEKLFLLEKKYNIPIVATGDCHYFSKEDKFSHEVMLAVQTRATMSDPNRMTFGKSQCHIHDFTELHSFFPDREDILWRSGQIADRCEFDFETNKLFFPKFDVPLKNTSPNQYFKTLSEEGFAKLCESKKIPSTQKEEYFQRLQMEIEMISKMGFSTYFLIVSDFILWAKKNKIAVGPGRGSVAGSLVAWALSITDVDPIKYKLFFERFLNPERISMPDIDLDFCILGREKVINYVKDTYGHDRVGQIITFGSMQSKGAVKDVARALGFPFEEANAITDMIPDELKITLDEAIEKEPKLKQMIESNSKIKELFDIARRLEGLTRHASKHAAGIIISPEPISDVLPIYIPPKSKEIVTQYAMTELELLGFLKIDFLGLKNLTLIQNILQLLSDNRGIVINILDIPMDDLKTFTLLQKGETSGVFQLESNGIRDVLRRLKPTTFEEIIAVNALYRPGPLGSGMVEDFIERKHGKQKVNYFFDVLKEVLEDTYGVIVYQEQVMQIANKLAGYTLGESDILRRAMGKKKIEEMAKQKDLFIKKATDRGFDKKKIQEIFELMEYFAGYGFNKAHSAAYALIAYQTAYLKANYPIEFMSCLISLELGDQDKALQYIKSAKDIGVSVMGPDINISVQNFIPEKEGIRFGLLGIKNVGGVAAENILEERKKNGEFIDLANFFSRIDLRVCNKRVLESIIASGACDNFPHTRAEMIINLDYTMEFAAYIQEKKNSGQLDLFDSYDDEEKSSQISNQSTDTSRCFSNWKIGDTFSRDQILDMEREVLGLYMSHHPLEAFSTLKNICQIPSLLEAEKKNNQKILISIISFRQIETKKGDRMAFGLGEDESKKIELIFFPKIYQKYELLIKKRGPVIICGDMSESTDETLKIKVGKIIDLDSFSYSSIKELTISGITEDSFDSFSKLINEIKDGEQEIILALKDDKKKYLHTISKKYFCDEVFLKNIKDLGFQIKSNYTE